MMMITCFDVVGRYVFGKPIFGATEMIQTLLAVTIFATLVLASAKDAHIFVPIFSSRIRAKFPNAEPLVLNVVSSIGLGVICYGIFKVGFDAYQTNRTTVVLEWSIALIAFICLFFSIVAAISQLFSKGERNG